MEEDFLKIKELNQQLDTVIRKSYEEVNQVCLKVQQIKEEPTINEPEKSNMIDQKLMQESIEMSVKPTISIPNKRKKIKMNVKKYAFIAAATTVLMTSVSLYTVNQYKQNQPYIENMKDYKETIYNPNTTYEGVRYSESLKENIPIHNHNWEEIASRLYEKYTNPATAFYMYYFTLDEYCQKNNLNVVLNEINQFYGMNFQSLEDVYKFAGVDNYKDFQDYAKKDLNQLKEGFVEDGENRSSNPGR